MSNGVQTVVSGVPAPGVAGDFASANKNRYSVLSGPGGLVAGSAGVIVGHFGWLSQQSLDPDNAAQIVNSFFVPNAGAGSSSSQAPDGFVSRPDAPAVITTYLADATMLINPGFAVPLHSAGDFWCKNDGSGTALVGQKAYANLLTGAASFAATGTPNQSTSDTTSVAAGTWSATGSINGSVMTVGAVTGSQGLPIGALVSVGAATGSVVVAQLSGVARGAGTYALSIGGQTVASGTALSGTFGILTVGGTIVGPIDVGALVAGSGIPSGSIVTDSLTYGNTHLTGAGGAGTYVTNLTGTGGSGSITFNTNVETKWVARSSGAAGEIVKISETPQ